MHKIIILKKIKLLFLKNPTLHEAFFSFLDLIVFVGSRGPVMKLKGHSIGSSRKSKGRNIDVEILQATDATEEAT